MDRLVCLEHFKKYFDEFKHDSNYNIHISSILFSKFFIRLLVEIEVKMKNLITEEHEYHPEAL